MSIDQLFVRDDGTVDWDGAIQSGREVARFGQVGIGRLFNEIIN